MINQGTTEPAPLVDGAQWIELHLLPQLQDFRPDPEVLQAWLSAWGLKHCSGAVAFDGADEWDQEEPDIVAEQEDLPLTELGDFLARASSAHLYLDPGPCELVSLLKHLSAGCRQQWQPCVVMVTWGKRSIPDLANQQTAALSSCSLVIAGPGELSKPNKTMAVIRDDDQVRAVQDRLSAIWDMPVRVFATCANLDETE